MSTANELGMVKAKMDAEGKSEGRGRFDKNGAERNITPPPASALGAAGPAGPQGHGKDAPG